MPVRKIVASTISFRGVVVSRKPGLEVEFESTLERDFAFLLEYNKHVSEYEAQPLKIEFRDNEGKKRRYTPDFLVKYSKDFEISKQLKPTLYEVKYRDDLRENFQKYKPKFRAAIAYCKKMGWEFRLITERSIRTERLSNARFLLRYRYMYYPSNLVAKVQLEMAARKITTPAKLLSEISQGQKEYGINVAILWNLIATGAVEFDQSTKLTMSTEIWVGKHFNHE